MNQKLLKIKYQMTKYILFLAVLVTLVASAPPNDGELDETYTFKQYLKDFNKEYDIVEHFLREFIFHKNLRMILKHNADET